MPKKYPPKLKFQVVLEVLTGEKSVGQAAKIYGVHPNSVNGWKQGLLENSTLALHAAAASRSSIASHS